MTTTTTSAQHDPLTPPTAAHKPASQGAAPAHCDDHCHSTSSPEALQNPRYRQALWVALLINALMFGVELWGGVRSGSVSLLADAIDFAGDAGNYAISLVVLGMGLAWRARAALFKAACMLGFGLFVGGKALWHLFTGAAPEPFTMGAIAVLALLANVTVALLLYAFREGDANMRSVWLCTRNDALGNLAIVVAAFLVWLGAGRWPDLAVALVMAYLAITAGWSVLTQARGELALSDLSHPHNH